MGRSYAVKGVMPPRYWEPKKGDVVYLEGTKTSIKRVGSDDGTPYVWFTRSVRGTVAMSVRNLQMIARIAPSTQQNPTIKRGKKIKARWVRRNANGTITVAI